jgi:WD40 repeat protein
MNKRIIILLNAIALSATFAAFSESANASWLSGVRNAVAGAPDSGKRAKYEFTLNEEFNVTSIAWSFDGQYIADSSTQRSEVNIWSVGERRIVQHLHFEGANPEFHSLAFSPNKKWLAFCDGASKLSVYAVRDWTLEYTHAGEGFCHGRVAFSSDSTLLAVHGLGLRVINTENWSEKKSVDSNWMKGKATDLIAFLPKTHDLIIAGGEYIRDYSGQVKTSYCGVLWILAEGELIPGRRIPVYPPDPYTHYNSTVMSIATSPDGKQITTGANTGAGPDVQHTISAAVRIVDIATGRIVGRPLDGLVKGEQTGMTYSSDGHFIIVGDADPQSPALDVISVPNLLHIDRIGQGDPARDVASDPLSSRFAVAEGSRIVVFTAH